MARLPWGLLPRGGGWPGGLLAFEEVVKTFLEFFGRKGRWAAG
jgi:hypothetical protein